MSRIISSGIDVGTTAVKVVVAEYARGTSGASRRIIGTGSSESAGLRHGYIIDAPHVSRAVRTAVAQAERASGVQIKSAQLSVGGVGLEQFSASGAIAIGRDGGVIGEHDISRALAASRHALPEAAAANRKIIHSIPLSWKADGKEALGSPLGLSAQKLEVKTLFITSLEAHTNDLVEAVERVGIEVEDVVASPIASAVATLSKAQRIAGCVLVDIGGETVSIAVYENDVPVSLKVFPVGATDITNDIALGLKIPLEDAEKLKIAGGPGMGMQHPKKKLDDIVGKRLKNIFALVEAHLKKIGRNGLLPAGVVLTGGGSRIASVEELAKAALALPSRVGHIEVNSTAHGEVYDPSWTVAYGLAILGLTSSSPRTRGSRPFVSRDFSALKGAGGKIGEWVKRFLP